MDSSLTPNLEDSELSLTPNLEHSERISRSMRVLSYEEANEGVSRYIEGPLQEMVGLTSWDLSFAEYIEEHKKLEASILLVRQRCWSCFQSGRPSWHLGGATRRHAKQGARTRPLCNLSRGSGEEQKV